MRAGVTELLPSNIMKLPHSQSLHARQLSDRRSDRYAEIVMTVFAQVCFHDAAKRKPGDARQEKVIGSALLAQQFKGRIISGRVPRPAVADRARPVLRLRAAAMWTDRAGR